MTKTASSRRTILFSIIPFIIILLILFLTMWVPFLGIMKECRAVFSGKISTEDKALGRFNFDSDYTAQTLDAANIKGSIFFTFALHNGNTGVIYAISIRSYYDDEGNVLKPGFPEPMKIELEKVNGEWKVSYMYYTRI